MRTMKAVTDGLSWNTGAGEEGVVLYCAYPGDGSREMAEQKEQLLARSGAARAGKYRSLLRPSLMPVPLLHSGMKPLDCSVLK